MESINHGELGFKCTECIYKAAYLGNLKAHVEKVHIDSSVPASTKTLKKRDSQLFECGFCEASMQSKGTLKRHIIRFHNIYACNKCQFSADSLQNLQEHETAEHDKVICRSCSSCDFVESSDGINLRKHRKEVHGFNKIDVQNNQQMNYDGELFGCKKCDFKSKYRPSVVRHIAGAHEGIKYSCDECIYTAFQRVQIQIQKQVYIL